MQKFVISLFTLVAVFNLAQNDVLAVREQAIAVRGYLKCGDAPARNVRVKLWDEDSGILFLHE